MLFIVTGASSGIGFAVATSLATRNHDVIAVARNAERLGALKNRCGDRVQIIPADLATDSGRISVVEKVKFTGKVDGIVHAAGSLITPTDYRNLNADKIVADLNIHVTVPIALNNALQNELAGGRILYIDSFSASSLRVGWSGYSIAKAAAQMAARAASEEITESAIIRVFPGAVQTPLVESVLSSQQSSPTRDIFKKMKSNGTIIEPDVIGEYIADILVTATDQQLEERETWDFNNPNDRAF